MTIKKICDVCELQLEGHTMVQLRSCASIKRVRLWAEKAKKENLTQLQQERQQLTKYLSGEIDHYEPNH
jgi:hypothetical protein